MKIRFLSWSDNPFLSIVLVAVLLFLSVSYYRADLAFRAPILTGYDWGDHPKSLMIVVPPDECGCGTSPKQLVSEALGRGFHVVVAYSGMNELVQEMRKSDWVNKQVSMVSVSPPLIAQFAPDKKTGIIQVTRGRIVFQSSGTVTTDTLKSLDS